MRTAGGFYCSKCGATFASPGSGAIYCGRCGNMGLRQFEGARPRRVPCPVKGCREEVWHDGGVNPGYLQHNWARHDEARRISEAFTGDGFLVEDDPA